MSDSAVLIQPLPMQRDNCGNWTHPSLPDFGESGSYEPIARWLEVQGLDSHMVALEDDLTADEYDAWQAKGDYDAEGWEPTPPAGDGWFVLSIHDTEVSPVCWWARRKMVGA